MLFTLDQTRYKVRVERLQADLSTAINNIEAMKGQLSEAVAYTTHVSAERDRLFLDYQRYLKGSKAKVNPFSERDIDTGLLLIARADWLSGIVLLPIHCSTGF